MRWRSVRLPSVEDAWYDRDNNFWLNRFQNDTAPYSNPKSEEFYCFVATFFIYYL